MAEKPKRTDIDVEEFRKLLLEEHGRLLEEHRRLRTQMVEEAADSAENELSGYATFDPADNSDTASLLYDRERDQALDENAQEMLKKIEHALSRIDDGTYGICEVTGKPIPVERLRAIPWATMTVEAAERYEQ